nr:MAG TPA: hypothetical protein [Caudoviricetes sp.]
MMLLIVCPPSEGFFVCFGFIKRSNYAKCN